MNHDNDCSSSTTTTGRKRSRFLIGCTGVAAILLLTFIVFFISLFTTPFFREGEDDFGKDIVIPQDMKVRIPKEKFPQCNGTQDAEGEQLKSAFRYASDNKIKASNYVQVDLQSLSEFKGKNRQLLLRHLASSAKWLLTEEDGKLYAYRRFMVNGAWSCSLNGYYSEDESDSSNLDKEINYQVRMVIGPDEPVFTQPWWGIKTQVPAGKGKVKIKMVDQGQGYDSYLVITSSGGALEVMEEWEGQTRPFTAAALRAVESELESVLRSATARKKGFDINLMPFESVCRKPASIELVGSDGIYRIYALVNPGEPGFVYPKVFEATRGTPLSGDSIPKRSLEYTGWSEDPTESFLFNTEIMVYEGDRGTYYPARIELWFKPASGKPERKLVSDVFKISGWERQL